MNKNVKTVVATKVCTLSPQIEAIQLHDRPESRLSLMANVCVKSSDVRARVVSPLAVRYIVIRDRSLSLAEITT